MGPRTVKVVPPVNSIIIKINEMKWNNASGPEKRAKPSKLESPTNKII